MAARANYVALDLPDISFCTKELCRCFAYITPSTAEGGYALRANTPSKYLSMNRDAVKRASSSVGAMHAPRPNHLTWLALLEL